ncbi:MAG: hypothetical protein ACE5I9_01980 [Candidatus Methylomirabilales bacterium]
MARDLLLGHRGSLHLMAVRHQIENRLPARSIGEHVLGGRAAVLNVEHATGDLILPGRAMAGH